jgi:endogenous inhibitor of DNA gyrase (YacG/DUF329 family)
MTSPAVQITVTCPNCGRVYSAYYRPSINLSLGEEWTEAETEEASSATCPSCGHVVDLNTLIVE